MPSQLNEVVQTWLVANQPLVVGIGVTLLVLAVLLLQHRRRHPVAPVPPPPVDNPIATEKALSWAPPEQSFADRRGAVRREGAPIRVTLASSTFRNGIGDGAILDRSTGGLRIATTAAVAPGTTLQVRAMHAPDNVGFVTVIVRSCLKNGDHYEVGCEFEKTPPWNVLLLFG